MTDTSLLYSLSGLGVGILVGLTGVGGGSLMTPLLVLLFGVHPVSAVATDLLYAAVTKAVGTAAHNRNSAVNWRITGLLALGSVPASALALLFVASSHKTDPGFAESIKTALGYVLLFTAVLILFRNLLLRKLLIWRGPPSLDRSLPLDITTVVVGLILGVLVASTSVGAGALGVTALIVLYPTTPTHRIIASDIAHAVPLTLVSGLGYWYMGEVNFGMLGALLAGSIPGILIGSWISPKTPEGVLRPILACILAIVGLRLVWT